MYGIMTEERITCENRIDKAGGRITCFEVIMPLRAAANESQKTRNKKQNV